jgi:hypothetical protein
MTRQSKNATVAQVKFFAREEEVRRWFDEYLKANLGFRYDTLLNKISEPVDKSVITKWKAGEVSASTSPKARLVMEAVESMMLTAPTGDINLRDNGALGEPRDDDERALFDLILDLRDINKKCERFPERLVTTAGRFAVNAKNLVARDRCRACGNVLLYVREGMSYATGDNISESALRQAVQRAHILKEAGLLTVDQLEKKEERDSAPGRLWNYESSLTMLAALCLGDMAMFDEAVPRIMHSLEFHSRTKDGLWVNHLEIIEKLLGSDPNRGLQLSVESLDKARKSDLPLIRRAFGCRALSAVRDHWLVLDPSFMSMIQEEVSE